MKEIFSLKDKNTLFLFLFGFLCIFYVIYIYFLSYDPYYSVGSLHNYTRLLEFETFSAYARKFPYSIGLKLQSYFLFKYLNFDLVKFKMLSAFFSFASMAYGFYLMKKFFGGWVSSFALIGLMFLSGWFDFVANLALITYSQRTFLSFAFLHVFLVFLDAKKSPSFTFLLPLSLFLSLSLFIHYSLFPQFFASCLFLLFFTFLSKTFFKKERVKAFSSYFFLFLVGASGLLVFYIYFRHPEMKNPRKIIRWLFFLKSGHSYTYSDIASFFLNNSKVLISSVFNVDFQEVRVFSYNKIWLSFFSLSTSTSSIFFLFYSFKNRGNRPYVFLSYSLLISFLGPAFLSLFDIHPFGHVRYQAYFYVSFLFTSALGFELLLKKIFSFFTEINSFEKSRVSLVSVVSLFLLSATFVIYKAYNQRKITEKRQEIVSEQIRFLNENKELPWVLQNYSLVYLTYYGLAKKNKVYKVKHNILEKMKNFKEFILISESQRARNRLNLPSKFRFSDIGMVEERKKFFVLSKLVSEKESLPVK